MKPDLNIVLQALRAIYEDPLPTLGICSNFYTYYSDFYICELPTGEMDEPPRRGDLDDFLNCYFRRWPKFSGNIEYPVPHPKLNSHTAYNEACDLWDRETKYGHNQWGLLEFIIAEIEKEIQENKS